MKAAGAGSIINISSRSGLVGIPMAAAYASSKAAIRNHTKTVALYCASRGWQIRCNSLHPAAILTDIWEPMLGDGPDRETRMQSLVADTRLKRFGMPEEVAAMAVYLGGDEASYTTGQIFLVDGGFAL
jgi:NAD(P)-dependent dehydrogenase (short-subunit alcohol dehydrogenase family)